MGVPSARPLLSGWISWTLRDSDSITADGITTAHDLMVKGSAEMSDSDDRPWRSEIPRRDFVKLAGYSTAAVSLGAQLGLPAWAQALPPRPPAWARAGTP